jgi:hypothetical protein
LVPFSQSIYAKATSASVTLIYPERSQNIARSARGDITFRTCLIPRDDKRPIL